MGKIHQEENLNHPRAFHSESVIVSVLVSLCPPVCVCVSLSVSLSTSYPYRTLPLSLIRAKWRGFHM